jgi:hypothetical protein
MIMNTLLFFSFIFVFLLKKDVVETHGRIENIKRLDEFTLNVQNDKQDNVRLVRYTIEGDPILHDLAYDGEKVEFKLDSTRDQYGSGEISTYLKDCSFLYGNILGLRVFFIF